ncbi:MAG: RagB/SusD family nutrient uptake outer membrane protein [Chitinophagaceae bacterium]|nr:RagB/SusD family nutrient uptake outer membrane protein [Chitinophagaceae bacterium]
MRKILTWIMVTAAIATFTACKKYLQETVVAGVSYQLYETPAGIEGALVSAYNTLRLDVQGERSLTFSDAGTDLFTVGSDGNTTFNEYLATLSSLDTRIGDYWDYHYTGIGQCNVTLDYLPKVTGMADSRKKVIEAEARFLRAWYYFDLVQHYGSVPLVLASTSKVVTDFKRAPAKDVYASILSDLTLAYGQLPLTPAQQGRVTKAAAAHLLAKVYLARGSAASTTQQSIRGTQTSDMDSVIYYASQIEGQQLGKYALVSDYAQLWDPKNQVNNEVIFAVQFSTNVISNGGGNNMHLYHVPQYDAVNTKILQRSVDYGRPYRRVRPTPYVYTGLFGATRMYDSRFVKSFVWGYIANQAATGITTRAGNKVDVKVGDTALYFSPVYYNTQTSLDSAVQANKQYPYYLPLNVYQPFSYNFLFPGLRKYLDPSRPTTNETNGTRDWVAMRYGETLLFLAEAYGRKGDFDKAAGYINQIRQRAAYKEGEMKTTQWWTIERGDFNDRTKNTVAQMTITAGDISNNFVDFILEERGREMLGELNRWEDLDRCEKLVERVKKYNPDAGNIRDYHVLRPIPQTFIDRLDPKQPIEQVQNPGYY